MVWEFFLIHSAFNQWGKGGKVMIEGVHLSSSTLSLHVASLALLWGIMTFSIYGMWYWCVGVPLSWQKLLQWSSIILGVMLLGGLSLVVISDGLRVAMTHVLLPAFLCAAAMYLFFRSLDRYFNYTGAISHVSYFRFITSAFMMYTILFLGMVIILRFQSYKYAQLFTISVHYVMYSMLLASVLLEVKVGSGTPLKQSFLPDEDDSNDMFE